MEKNHGSSRKEMNELSDIIQKEKETALKDFREEDFRSRLIRRIACEPKASRASVPWFRKPAVIFPGTALLFVILSGLAILVFSPSSSKDNAQALENALVQLFHLHGSMRPLEPLQIGPEFGEPDNLELEWSIKRVIFSIHREIYGDEDISRIVFQALQNLFSSQESGQSESGKIKILRQEESSLREPSSHPSFSLI